MLVKQAQNRIVFCGSAQNESGKTAFPYADNKTEVLDLLQSVQIYVIFLHLDKFYMYNNAATNQVANCNETPRKSVTDKHGQRTTKLHK